MTARGAGRAGCTASGPGSARGGQGEHEGLPTPLPAEVSQQGWGRRRESRGTLALRLLACEAAGRERGGAGAKRRCGAPAAGATPAERGPSPPPHGRCSWPATASAPGRTGPGRSDPHPLGSAPLVIPAGWQDATLYGLLNPTPLPQERADNSNALSGAGTVGGWEVVGKDISCWTYQTLRTNPSRCCLLLCPIHQRCSPRTESHQIFQGMICP